MTFTFKDEHQAKIIEKFGDAFFRKVKKLLDPVIYKWHIESLDLIQSYSANLVFKGHSKEFGPIVVKFGRDQGEFTSEVSMLKSFDNDVVSKIYDVDYDNMIFLMEAVEPGEELSIEKNMTKRLDAFTKLHKTLHEETLIKESDGLIYNYKTYEQWVTRITRYMKSRPGWEELAVVMEKAERVFYDLTSNYTSNNLLHGDLHYYNILQGRETYKAIDPKGVLGDPIFDVPRYILNEYWDEKDKSKIDNTVACVVETIGKSLGYDESDLYKALFVEATMAMSWNVESGADLSEQVDFLESANHIYSYLK